MFGAYLGIEICANGLNPGSCCCLEGVGIERAGDRNGREVRSVKFHVLGEQELRPVRRQAEGITSRASMKPLG